MATNVESYAAGIVDNLLYIWLQSGVSDSSASVQGEGENVSKAHLLFNENCIACHEMMLRIKTINYLRNRLLTRLKSNRMKP